jgi:hypothetical protein
MMWVVVIQYGNRVTPSLFGPFDSQRAAEQWAVKYHMRFLVVPISPVTQP